MTGPAVDPRPHAPKAPSAIAGTVLRYRVMAFFTGVGLIILTFIAVPLQVWGNSDTMVHIFGFIHGWGFVIYLLTVANLGLRLRWSLPRLLLVALAGTVPFCSFIAEHQVMKQIRADQAVTLSR